MDELKIVDYFDDEPIPYEEFRAMLEKFLQALREAQGKTRATEQEKEGE